MTAANPLNILEVRFEIFKYLPGETLFGVIPFVCKDWHQTVKSLPESFWKAKIRCEIPASCCRHVFDRSWMETLGPKEKPYLTLYSGFVRDRVQMKGILMDYLPLRWMEMGPQWPPRNPEILTVEDEEDLNQPKETSPKKFKLTYLDEYGEDSDIDLEKQEEMWKKSKYLCEPYALWLAKNQVASGGGSDTKVDLDILGLSKPGDFFTYFPYCEEFHKDDVPTFALEDIGEFNLGNQVGCLALSRCPWNDHFGQVVQVYFLDGNSYSEQLNWVDYFDMLSTSMKVKAINEGGLSPHGDNDLRDHLIYFPDDVCKAISSFLNLLGSVHHRKIGHFAAHVLLSPSLSAFEEGKPLLTKLKEGIPKDHPESMVMFKKGFLDFFSGRDFIDKMSFERPFLEDEDERFQAYPFILEYCKLLGLDTKWAPKEGVPDDQEFHQALQKVLHAPHKVEPAVVFLVVVSLLSEERPITNMPLLTRVFEALGRPDLLAFIQTRFQG